MWTNSADIYPTWPGFELSTCECQATTGPNEPSGPTVNPAKADKSFA